MALYVPKLLVTKKISRINVIFILKISSICCLFIVALYANNNSYSILEKLFVSIVFIARAALIRSATPLEKAIIMDIVDENNRGKWSSVESINRSIWTFSAALGGYLIDQYNFQVVFFITVGIYTFAVMELIPICFIVSRV